MTDESGRPFSRTGEGASLCERENCTARQGPGRTGPAKEPAGNGQGERNRMKMPGLTGLLVCFMLLIPAGNAAAEQNRIEKPEELYALFSDRTEKAETAFSFSCAGEAMDAWNDSETFMQFLAGIGIRGYHSTYTEHGSGKDIQITELNYMAGARILAYHASGRERELSARERDTLEAAARIAGEAKGSDQERERYIHDALCGRIRYYTDDAEGNDDDCAVGALLDGKANCDGYADAFYLTGGLAGLRIRYISGDGLTGRAEDAGHMWNLICLDGRWVMVDLTWDDADQEGGAENEDCFHLWYNAGAGRMRLDHAWSPETARWVSIPEEDAAGLIPEDVRYTTVADWSEAERRAAELESAGAGRICLRDGAGLGFENNHETLNRIIRRYGLEDYRWCFSPDAVEIICLSYQKSFVFCESEEQVAEAVGARAGQQTEEISIGLSAALAERLFADERKGLLHVLCMTGLDVPISFSYSEETGNIRILSPAWAENLLFVSDGAELQAALAENLPKKPERLQFEMTAPFDYREALNCVYRYGVAQYSIATYAGERLFMENPEYYPRYAILQEASEIDPYVQTCRRENAESFNVYLPGNVYTELAADSCAGIREILNRSLKNYRLSYSERDCYFVIQDAEYR